MAGPSTRLVPVNLPSIPIPGDGYAHLLALRPTPDGWTFHVSVMRLGVESKIDHVSRLDNQNSTPSYVEQVTGIRHQGILQ